jgi:hypothetical protein
MKNNKLYRKVAFMFGLFVFVTITVLGQDGKKVVAVINRADWCYVCQQNGEKVMKEVIPVFETSNVQFVMNDLTNGATKEKSKMVLTESKVYDAVKKISATGILLLIDGDTGKLIDKLSVAETKEKLVEVIKKSTMTER